ncbi:hypothetical protein [Aquibacillus rhizosphaerae]|uniref:Uncharacterized protein n=1 Tax=Aquibacillus rhizosphaerae TaxID=3051431 RepID=A0ABT7L5F9_9BACI|nr:hypothetical protein [Aquibacillus sp. LR5S19]MDL4841107.1 hypothetical protein [Aquibacillus sp. LR5S19]
MKLSISYIVTKFAAAGVTLSLFYVVNLVLSGWDLSSVNGMLSNPYIWLAFFGYAVVSSTFIDYLLKKSNGSRPWVRKPLYYTVASILIWLVLFLPSFTDFFNYLFLVLYASFFTVLCAWTYMLVYDFLQRRRLSLILLIVSLSFLLSIVIIQPSIQIGWRETVTDNSYHASFERFSGEEKEGMQLEGNQTYLISVNWNIQSGGYGWKVRDENGFANLEQTDVEYQTLLHTTYNGPYYFYINGNDAKGSVEVFWKEVK